MRKISITTCFLVFSLMIFAQNGPPWTGANFGQNYIFRAIDFPANQNTTGFACGESVTYQGNGIVMKTVDGGASWNPVWTGAGLGIEGASFVDLNTGYIAGWPKLAQGWSGFAKTTNGGAIWTSMPVTNDIYFFTDVVFKDQNNGILLGQTNSGGGVWYTSNGGTTWSMGTGLLAIPQHACHISGNTYYLADNDGHIQKSTNNGQTWTTVWNAGGSVYILGIDHFGDNTIMACGDYGLIVVSVDGGVNWTSQQVGSDIWHDFGWDSPDHVFVCGTPGLVYESWDKGTSWQNANPQGGGSSALYECIFTQDYHGFICGSQGVELKRNPGCIAGFTVSTTSACTFDSLVFTDQSWGNISLYDWSFEGGTPAISSDQNPVVTYTTPGIFDVKLRVSNPWWSDSIVKQNYINIEQKPAAPVITSSGNLLSSNISTGNQWFLNGTAIPGATGQTWQAVASGTYWDVVSSGVCSSDTSNNIYLVMTGIPDIQRKPVITPVPNQGRFSIGLSTFPGYQFEFSIYNPMGICVWRKKCTGSETDVNLGSITAGLYVLRITGNDADYRVPFIVE